LHFAWCEAHVEVKIKKTLQLRSIFESWDLEKVYAVVAQSRFRSQNVQKHPMLGALLEVEMFKKWAASMFKTPQLGGKHFRKLRC
jgi:hypothetical protein